MIAVIKAALRNLIKHFIFVYNHPQSVIIIPLVTLQLQLEIVDFKFVFVMPHNAKQRLIKKQVIFKQKANFCVISFYCCFCRSFQFNAKIN